MIWPSLTTATAQPGLVVVSHWAKTLSTLSVLSSAARREIASTATNTGSQSHREESRVFFMITSVKKILYYDEFGLIREVAEKNPHLLYPPPPTGEEWDGHFTYPPPLAGGGRGEG